MSKLNHIGIVGGGKMGASIFNFLCGFDFKLTWYIRTDWEKTEKKHLRKLNRSVKNELISQKEYELRKQNHTITNSIANLANCNLIIECINEDLNAKQDLINKLFSVIANDSIIASNSSSINPQLLSKIEEQKERIIGLHFFFPVEMKNIVELVTTPFNSKETIRETELFLTAINKFYLNQTKDNNYLLNRLMLHLQAAAFNLHKEQNLSFTEIDNAVDKYLFPIGIFAMMDHIGIDMIYNSALNYLDYETDKEPFLPLINYMRKCISENRLGIKTKIGFFNYNNPEPANPILNKDEKQIACSLANSYFSSYNWFIEKKLCKPSDLTFSMNEYLDTDTKKWSNLI